MNKKWIILFSYFILLSLAYKIVAADCIESDPGMHSFEKGTVEANGVIKTDYCVDTDGDGYLETAHEYYCYNGEEIKDYEHYCDLGCFDGGCIQHEEGYGAFILKVYEKEPPGKPDMAYDSKVITSISTVRVTDKARTSIASIDKTKDLAIMSGILNGTVSFSVEAEGYYPYNNSIYIIDRTTVHWSISLEKIPIPKDECDTDSECNDNDISTADKCEETPKKCNNKKITDCVSDGYCPESCTYPEDADCPDLNEEEAPIEQIEEESSVEEVNEQLDQKLVTNATPEKKFFLIRFFDWLFGLFK